MLEGNIQMLKINNKNWYVETKTGYDGPFESKEEAEKFQNLLKRSNAARIEFAGLQYTTPLES